MSSSARLPARVREDHARHAGAEAQRILAAAERTILAAMTTAAAKVAAGSLTPQLARRRVKVTTSATLGAASKQLQAVYSTAVKQVTGETGPLPDAPGQVATAILRAQKDADVAFGAVLAAVTGGGFAAPMPPPSSPYRKIINRAQRGTGASLPAAQAVIAAVSARGLTGYVSNTGTRRPLAVYAQQVVRVTTSRLAAAPVTGVIRQRRDLLVAGHLVAVATAWGAAVQPLDTGALVAAFQGDSRLASSAPDPAVAKRWTQEAAASAAAAWLGGVYSTGGYTGLLGALEAAVRDGMAEGEAGALAYAAERQRAGNLDMDAAFASALTTLQGDYGVTRQAVDAVQRILGGAAADVARALTGTTGGSEGEAEEAVEEALTGTRNAASRWTDFATWAAFGAGAVALYQRAQMGAGVFGVGILIDWQDEPGACPVCEVNTAGSPYAPVDVPPFPAHGSCRCNLFSDSDLPLSLMASFLN